MRYYFDVTDGYRTFEDEAGQSFESSDEAKAVASITAAELAVDSEGQYRGFFVLVIDDDGNEIARFPVPE